MIALLFVPRWWVAELGNHPMISDRIDLQSVAEPEPSNLPYPPSADDPGFMMIHIIDFNDQARYLDGRGPENGPISGGTP